MNRVATSQRALRQVLDLSCWQGEVSARPVSGGITNANFLVEAGERRYFVRIGEDIPEHGVMRFNERAASRAAAAAGISPAVVHVESGAMVLEYIEGRTLEPEDVRAPGMLERILPLVRRCHEQIPGHFRGPALVFWVFQVVRGYAGALARDGGRRAADLPRLLEVSVELEQAVGPIRLVFGHNDLLAANFIDDGQRLWLVDWDYAGFNSPLFDLGGLASNNSLDEQQERQLLQWYFDQPVDSNQWRRYRAMKCASLLRESLWSMVSEIHSAIDFDFVAYTEENLGRFETELEAYRKMNA